MTDRADYPLRTLRLCDSALKSQHSDGIPRRIWRGWVMERFDTEERAVVKYQRTAKSLNKPIEIEPCAR